jgi:hypothetical protein
MNILHDYYGECYNKDKQWPARAPLPRAKSAQGLLRFVTSRAHRRQ